MTDVSLDFDKSVKIHSRNNTQKMLKTENDKYEHLRNETI